MPLWLVIAFSKKKMVELEFPKHFEQKMRDEIAAGAVDINFREYSNYYFQVGMALAAETGNSDLRETLTQAFSGKRYDSLMTHSLSRSFIETENNYLLKIVRFKVER
jgi:hypothetical protein